MLKQLILLFLSFSIMGFSLAGNSGLIEINTGAVPGHPRILLLKGEERLIEQSIASDPVWKKMQEAILGECDRIVPMPPVERIKIGKRLLDKSREALRRIFYLSYAYRTTGLEKYAARAEKEMLAVSAFSDWNPSHFLDVAEMTMAVSIGYDWLYDQLSADDRETILNAIISKGLQPSFDPKDGWFVTANHNWNQVCNAGMTFGALATMEDDPDLAKKIIGRAVETIRLPMAEYKPDGAYPEGYSYWDYGTSFNVLFLSALDKAFGTDFDLSGSPGFLETAGFRENMTGVTGQCFNWSDSGLRGSLSPAMFWFAQKKHDPSLLWVEKSYLQTPDYAAFTGDRLLPAIMIWGKDLPLDRVTEPVSSVWMGEGASPVCLMRTSWIDPSGIYLGFKAGSASVNHAHMDIGSFVMEADGIRWASDFGSQAYESLESKGIDLWNRDQDSERWTVFRLNNRAHNTLTVDDQLQQVKGDAQIDRYSGKPEFPFALSELTPVYENQLDRLTRGVAIVDQKYVVIRDELKTLAKPVTTVRWTMMTTADVSITGTQSATLTKNGKKLLLKVDSPAKIRMKTWRTEPTTNYDAPNPGTILVGFECDLPANTREILQVLLIPGAAGNPDVSFDLPLNKWE